jgi:hypothetical protein
MLGGDTKPEAYLGPPWLLHFTAPLSSPLKDLDRPNVVGAPRTLLGVPRYNLLWWELPWVPLGGGRVVPGDQVLASGLDMGKSRRVLVHVLDTGELGPAHRSEAGQRFRKGPVVQPGGLGTRDPLGYPSFRPPGYRAHKGTDPRIGWECQGLWDRDGAQECQRRDLHEEDRGYTQFVLLGLGSELVREEAGSRSRNDLPPPSRLVALLAGPREAPGWVLRQEGGSGLVLLVLPWEMVYGRGSSLPLSCWCLVDGT